MKSICARSFGFHHWISQARCIPGSNIHMDRLADGTEKGWGKKP